jgi:hypothetical protein
MQDMDSTSSFSLTVEYRRPGIELGSGMRLFIFNAEPSGHHHRRDQQSDELLAFADIYIGFARLFAIHGRGIHRWECHGKTETALPPPVWLIKPLAKCLNARFAGDRGSEDPRYMPGGGNNRSPSDNRPISPLHRRPLDNFGRTGRQKSGGADFSKSGPRP